MKLKQICILLFCSSLALNGCGKSESDPNQVVPLAKAPQDDTWKKVTDFPHSILGADAGYTTEEDPAFYISFKVFDFDALNADGVPEKKTYFIDGVLDQPFYFTSDGRFKARFTCEGASCAFVKIELAKVSGKLEGDATIYYLRAHHKNKLGLKFDVTPSGNLNVDNQVASALKENKTPQIYMTLFKIKETGYSHFGIDVIYASPSGPHGKDYRSSIYGLNPTSEQITLYHYIFDSPEKNAVTGSFVLKNAMVSYSAQEAQVKVDFTDSNEVKTLAVVLPLQLKKFMSFFMNQ